MKLILFVLLLVLATTALADDVTGTGDLAASSRVPESSFKCEPVGAGAGSLEASWTAWLSYDVGYDLRLVDCGSGVKCLKVVPFAY